MQAAPDAWVRTTCPYCGVGCGVLAKPSPDGKAAEIKGDPDHPANFGRLCSKGSALADTLSLDDRLLHPLINGERADWNKALDSVASRFASTIAEHGADSVAFYVSGQLLTEDYYVANKLMKGFIGSANIDSNSRLCMASSVAGHKRAFGSDTVPGCYEDLELADLVVLVGSNLAWCHPVLYQRLEAARAERGTRIVVIDPRRTATCEIADLHLALEPGSDVALFNGLLVHLQTSGVFDHTFIAQHTSGYDEALATARQIGPDEIASRTGLSWRDIEQFYRWFTECERVVTVYSQGVNQSTSGTDKVNAILNCHLATGRIGRQGMGPLSVTGQPNAMGGREVGGLANMLAAHMDLDNASHRQLVQSYWGAAAIADKSGFKAVDMFEAVAKGRIKAIWIMATNPVDSMPQADRIRDTLANCPFVVVSDVVRHTDTTEHADVLLPSTSWGEKDGTVTNSERRISRQRSFLSAPGEARPDWWQLAEVAKRMGFSAAFDYGDPQQIFVEHARLTGLDNNGSRDFDISAAAKLTASEYAELEPFQWPKAAGNKPGVPRMFADGKFFNFDRRARFVPTPCCGKPAATSDRFPLVLNTGRIRDQWHTMTRTAKAPRLMSHFAEPYVEVHPDDADRFGLAANGLAEVVNRSGRIIVRVKRSENQRPGSIFVPMHWTDQFAGNARVDAMVAADCDPSSGQPGLKQSAVAIAPFDVAWHGLAVSQRRPDPTFADYWALARTSAGWRVEMAGRAAPDDFTEFARATLGLDHSMEVELLAYHDHAAGQHRFAAFEDCRLLGALFMSPKALPVDRAWLADRLHEPNDDQHERLRVLAGRSGGDVKDRGPIVCACFGVGLYQIAEAARTGQCLTADAVAERLGAGSNCGSCRSEIGRIIRDSQIAKAG